MGTIDVTLEGKDLVAELCDTALKDGVRDSISLIDISF